MFKITILLLLAAIAFSKQVKITYYHRHKTIALYQHAGQPVVLLLSFENNELQLPEQLKLKPLFFDKQEKIKVDLRKAKYDYKVKAGLREQKSETGEGSQPIGSIGIGEGGALFQLVKLALNTSAAKIEVHHREGVLVGLGEGCSYPIFLPLMTTVSQANTHSYQIAHFSTSFLPGSSFLKVIDRQRTPFEMTKQQLEQQLTVSMRDRVISIPLTQLLKCGKFANSETFECELQEKEGEVGGLVFDFDVTLCGGSLEFDRVTESAWGYHYSHLVLLVLQFILLSCLVRGDRVKKLMENALGYKTA